MLTVIGLSHAEDVAHRATRGVTDHHHPAFQQTEAEDAAFTIVLARIFHFNGEPFENFQGILEVQPPVRERLLTFGRILGDTHGVIVDTKTWGGKRRVPAEKRGRIRA